MTCFPLAPHTLMQRLRKKDMATSMEFRQSQWDMNRSYIGGATGVFASGLVWLVAAIVGLVYSQVGAVITLCIGGMFIFPLSVLFSKCLAASGKHAADNALRHLALETLPVLFGGLLIALYVAQIDIGLFFPIMLLTIGARYFAFHTLYGLKAYWVLGALLMVAGIACTVLSLSFVAAAFAGGVGELVLAGVIYRRSKSARFTEA